MGSLGERCELVPTLLSIRAFRRRPENGSRIVALKGCRSTAAKGAFCGETVKFGRG